jgi:hypothetical protein
MSKTNNPANPENNGTLPAKKLYTQDEVDALLANKSKIALLWTNPDPTSDFAAQTITVDGLTDYDYMAISFHAGQSSPTGTIIVPPGTDGGYANGASGNVFCRRKFTVADETITFSDGETVSSYGSTSFKTADNVMKPTFILGIKL